MARWTQHLGRIGRVFGVGMVMGTGWVNGDVLWSESFETEGAGTRYTRSEADFSNGDGDYCTRTDGSNIGSAVSLSGQDGSWWFGGQDHDGEAHADLQTITWSNISIYGYSSIEFKGLFAEDDASDSQEDWDGTSYVLVEYQIDSGSWTTLIEFQAKGADNAEPAEDTDGDGLGDGAALTPAFAEFVKTLPGAGSSLNLRVSADGLSDGDEDWNIDNFRIEGTLPPAAPVATAATSVEASSFIANWNSVIEANGYFLDVSTNESFRIQGNAPAYGDGSTSDSPLSVGNALTTPEGVSEFWVMAYIVGSDYDDFEAPWDDDFTVSLADSVDETSSGNCIQLKLEDDGGRADWGLNSNPENVGKLIIAKGYRDVYYEKPSIEGVRNLDISELQASSQSFLPGYDSLDVGDTTSQTVSGLSSETDYYYRVRAYGSGGAESANSNTQMVTTVAGAVPELDVLNADETVSYVSSSVTVTGSSANVTSSLSWSNSLTSVTGTETAGDIWSISDIPLGIGINTITVTGGGNGETRSDSVTITREDIAAPASVMLIDTNATELSAQWAAVDGAAGYLIDVSTSPTFVKYGAPGVNLMSNPGFETGDDTHWDTFATGYVVTNDSPYSGTYCVRCDATATRAIAQDVTIPLADGNTAYELSYWYRVTAGDGTDVRIWSTWDNGLGSGDSLQPSSYNPESSVWVQVAYTNTPAAGATSLRFEVRTYSGATVFLDDFSVASLGNPLPNYVPGYEDYEVASAEVDVSGLVAETVYYLRVSAKNGADVSGESDVVDALTPPHPGVTLIILR